MVSVHKHSILAPATTVDPKYRALCKIALEAAKAAFAPISGFAVGAAIQSIDGQVFTGQNQEDSAMDSIHAEIAATIQWNAAGEPKISAIAIVGFRFWPIENREAVTTPCGRCRQWLYEAIVRSNSHPKIICANGDLSKLEIFEMKELLPDAFSLEAALYENWYKKMRPKLQSM
jgi:cytidine deaminase